MYTIEGTVKRVLPVQEGDSQRGHWVRGGIVIDYNSGNNYSKSAPFTFFGEEKLAVVETLGEGDSVRIDFDIDGREYNGKWYTDLQAVRIIPARVSGGQAALAVQPAQPAAAPQVTAEAVKNEEEELPF